MPNTFFMIAPTRSDLVHLVTSITSKHVIDWLDIYFFKYCILRDCAILYIKLHLHCEIKTIIYMLRKKFLSSCIYLHPTCIRVMLFITFLNMHLHPTSLIWLALAHTRSNHSNLSQCFVYHQMPTAALVV